jgi:hypothetical protein
MGSIETPSAKLHISSPQVEELRAQLKTSKLLTPDSEGYADSIKRWSGAAERPAVRSNFLALHSPYLNI